MQERRTEVVRVDPVHPEREIIEQGASLLQDGKLVVFPTETVYGLGADALQAEAVKDIFVAKGRPFNDPLIVHIAEEETLEILVKEVPKQARKLAEAFWPGPLTLIMPAGWRVPMLVTAGLPSVAIRMPRHPVALDLIRATGSPIAAPSANRFMHVSPTTAQHALADLAGRVPLILDGGPCEVGVESTVLDLCAETPTILRPGGVSLEALRAVLPEVQPPVRPHRQNRRLQEGALKSPGQMSTHYAPVVPMLLFEGSVEATRAAMLAEVQRRHAQSEQVGLLLADEDVSTFEASGAEIYRLGSTAEQVASKLFAGLRALEETGVQVILCRNVEVHGLGLAVHDRLLKAAGGMVIVASESYRTDDGS